MSTPLTPEQLQRLSNIGISISNRSIGQIPLQTTTSTPTPRLLPLLSISGLTIFSLGSLFLLKSKIETTKVPPSSVQQVRPDPSLPAGRQVPKSIQHYLLTSQQYFTQAVQVQQSQPDQQNSELVKLLNQSLLAATQAIKDFPTDFRGWEQRSRIYQALVDSHGASPDPAAAGEGGTANPFLPQAISDLSRAFQLNPSSADITRSLAALFAKKGDPQNTLVYLSQTVALQPTKAQNFYDLAILEQQVGLLPQALETYNRLLPLLTDSEQKTKVEAEKQSLEKLVAQTNPSDEEKLLTTPSPSPRHSPEGFRDEGGPLLEASLPGPGLIIAAPDSTKNITVKDQTNGNSLSGESTILSGEKQITITNSRLTSTSQVYVTITQGNTPGTLQVLSKSSNSFTVGFDSPTSIDIQFRWWIIN